MMDGMTGRLDSSLRFALSPTTYRFDLLLIPSTRTSTHIETFSIT